MTDHIITLVVVCPLIVATLVAVIGDLCHSLSADKPVESTQTLEMTVPRVEYQNRLKIASMAISGAHATSFEVAHRDTDHDLPEVKMVRPYFDAYERGELPALRAAQAVVEYRHGRDVLERVLSGLHRL